METKVLITGRSCDYYNQVGVLKSRNLYGCIFLSKIVMDDGESIYIESDRYCLVQNMVTRVHDGIPVMLTPQEAEEFDSKIKRNKIFLQPSDG